MTVLIKLTTAGADSGPFDLYSNADGYTTPFESNVNKGALISGYTSSLVPDTATIIKISSLGGCIAFVDIPLTYITTTSTSTTGVPTTTTSTTPGITTTTTSTTAVPLHFYTLSGPFSDASSTPGVGACSIPSSYPNIVKSTSTPNLFLFSIVTVGFGDVRFPGGGNYYRVKDEFYCVQIDGSGVVTDVQFC